jgi:Icc-related predicted phosphoesterase
MNESNASKVRVITTSDLHQSERHYRSLSRAVAEHRPDVVAIVGDALEACSAIGKDRLDVSDCAKMLSELPVEHLVFVRGNHEDSNWSHFVYAWPHDQRKLIGLHGTGYIVGPLVIIGFPCLMGWEDTWCEHLPAAGNVMEIYCAKHRAALPSDPDEWLPALLRQFGAAGRALWLMHESPVAQPIAHPQSRSLAWTGAVERYSPRVVVCGHDHNTPIRNRIWHAQLGDSLCVNVGQAEADFHYSLIDFKFEKELPCLPSQIKIRAFPWGQEVNL